MKIVLVFLILGITAAHSEPDYQSANYILPFCKSAILRDGASFQGGFCFGSISGIGFADQSTCVPAGVTPTQEARVVVNFLEANPARLHEAFFELATEALRQAWPCKK